MSTDETLRPEFESAMGRAGYELNPTRFRDGSYTTAYYEAGWAMFNAARAAIKEELERTARNRDMWKAQCERQAAELEKLRRGECICTRCGLRQPGESAGPVPF